jgi:hypothetical protein
VSLPRTVHRIVVGRREPFRLCNDLLNDQTETSRFFVLLLAGAVLSFSLFSWNAVELRALHDG